MYIFLPIVMYVYIYVNAYVYAHEYAHAYVCVYVCVCIYIYIHIHIHVYTHTSNRYGYPTSVLWSHPSVCVCARTNKHKAIDEAYFVHIIYI